MDPTSAALEQDRPFGYEDSLELSFVQPSAAAAAAFDAGTPDLELCQLAATGNIAAFEAEVGDVGRGPEGRDAAGEAGGGEEREQEADVHGFSPGWPGAAGIGWGSRSKRS